MQQRRTWWMRAAWVAGWLAAAVWLAVNMHRSDNLAYLPAFEGQPWWVAPRTASADPHFGGETGRLFRARFVLDAEPEEVRLLLAVFRQGEVRLNGTAVPGGTLQGPAWKRPAALDLTRLVRGRTNEITVRVTNPAGPAALWAALRIRSTSPARFLQWEVSGPHGQWEPARPADAPMLNGPEGYLRSFTTLPELARRAAGWALGLACVLSGLTLGLCKSRAGAVRAIREFLRGPGGDRALMFAGALSWAVLFLNNLPQLPRIYGFDAEGHEAYIRYIQQRGQLPLADEGWQMYQPPLYYLLGAALLGLTGLSVEDDLAVLLLRAFNGVVGFAHACLVFAVLRMCHPDKRWPARVGFVLAAALPAHLVVAQYVTNEPLAAFWVTLGLVCTLRARQRGGHAGWMAAGGAALGLAMLTKFSTLPAVPVVLAAGWPAPADPGQGQGRSGTVSNRGGRTWLGMAGAVVTFVLVCGWHYARVWLHFGRPLVGNWDVGTAAWWQDPGLRTAADFTRVGAAWIHPWLSGMDSFWDGLYATLWGDGLISSASWMVFRPPWNEAWMAMAWWLGAVWTVLVVAGAVVGFVMMVRRPREAEWMGPTLLGLYGLALIYMSVRVPSYAQVKAFYALPALAGLAMALVQGWRGVAGASRTRHAVLGVLLGLWAVFSLGSFWVRSAHPQTVLVQALWALDRGDDARAWSLFRQAVRLDPDRPELELALERAVRARPLHAELLDLYATVLASREKWAEAVAWRRTAVERFPDRPDLRNNLAWLLVTVPVPELRDPAAAVRHAREACARTAWQEPVCVGTLAAALAAAGRFEEAVQRAGEAIALARHQGRADLVERNSAYLEAYRAGRLPRFNGSGERTE